MKSKSTKIWLIADTHFGHEKLIEWGRPEDFEERLILGLSCIGKDDVLIHLGDFCIGEDDLNHKQFMLALPDCKKILIRGNHDNKSDTWYYNHGWDFVSEFFINTFFGKRFCFSHIPDPPMAGVNYNIHGHTHGNAHRDIDVRDYYNKDYHIEIAPELTNYQPVLLTQKLIK